MIPSLFLSYGNYTTAKEHIIDDVNQALAQTILYKQSDRITADTLKVYRSKLKIDRLKKTSYLAMCTEETSNVSFCSDTMTYTPVHCSTMETMKKSILRRCSMRS